MLKVFKLSENLNGNDYVVGDIHGTFTKLEILLEQIHFNIHHDRLFSVGDLVDRGLECPRVIEFLDQSWFYACMGNHEQMLIDANKPNIISRYDYHKDISPWFYNLNKSTQNLILESIRNLPYVIQIGNIGILHAEIPYKINDWDLFLKEVENPIMFEAIKNDIIWGRDRISISGDLPYESNNIRNIKRIFVGHSVVNNVYNSGNIHYIDTGSVFKYGKLSIVNIKTLETFSL